MTRLASKLRLLRWLFVVYLLVTLAIDGYFILNVLSGQGLGLDRMGIAPGALVTISVVTYAVAFGAVWLLFYLIQRKKRWARIALLVIGWVVVADAISSFLFTMEVAGLGQWLRHLTPGLDLTALLMLDRIKDVLGLLYFGFAIYVLQFDPKVKKEIQAR